MDMNFEEEVVKDDFKKLQSRALVSKSMIRSDFNPLLVQQNKIVQEEP